MSGSTRLGTSECLIPPQSGSFSVLAVSGGWSIITKSCGVGLDHYVQVLQDKRMQHGWTYGDHYLPHDIVVKEFTSGKSRRDTLAGKRHRGHDVPASNVLDGINVVRRMLGRVWIDPNRCERGRRRDRPPPPRLGSHWSN